MLSAYEGISNGIETPFEVSKQFFITKFANRVSNINVLVSTYIYLN